MFKNGILIGALAVSISLAFSSCDLSSLFEDEYRIATITQYSNESQLESTRTFSYSSDKLSKVHIVPSATTGNTYDYSYTWTGDALTRVDYSSSSGYSNSSTITYTSGGLMSGYSNGTVVNSDFVFDAKGKLQSYKDQDGSTVTYTWKEDQLSQVDLPSSTLTYTYDDGLLARIDDKGAFSDSYSTFKYDENDRIIEKNTYLDDGIGYVLYKSHYVTWEEGKSGVNFLDPSLTWPTNGMLKAIFD